MRHYRPAPLPPAAVGRVACGLFRAAAEVTKRRAAVECRNCRRSVLFQIPRKRRRRP
jgi:hypothetical protein